MQGYNDKVPVPPGEANGIGFSDAMAFGQDDADELGTLTMPQLKAGNFFVGSRAFNKVPIAQRFEMLGQVLPPVTRVTSTTMPARLPCLCRMQD